MSQSPFPDPYGNRPPNPYVQGAPGQYPGTGQPPSPYGQPGYPPQFAPRPASGGSSTILWILGILGGLMLFCCLGCGGFGAWAMIWVANTEAELVKKELESSPKAVEELGTPVEVKMNMGASIADDDNEIFVFDVTGPKGKGIVRANCDASDEVVKECYLEVNGKTIDVLKDENLDAMNEMIIPDVPGITPIEK